MNFVPFRNENTVLLAWVHAEECMLCNIGHVSGNLILLLYLLLIINLILLLLFIYKFTFLWVVMIQSALL